MIRNATVLLTGFEPFERDPLNPSWEVARALDGWRHGGATVRAVQLPCVFGRSIAALEAAIGEHRPVLVVGRRHHHKIQARLGDQIVIVGVGLAPCR